MNPNDLGSLGISSHCSSLVCFMLVFGLGLVWFGCVRFLLYLCFVVLFWSINSFFFWRNIENTYSCRLACFILHVAKCGSLASESTLVIS